MEKKNCENCGQLASLTCLNLIVSSKWLCPTCYEEEERYQKEIREEDEKYWAYVNSAHPYED